MENKANKQTDTTNPEPANQKVTVTSDEIPAMQRVLAEAQNAILVTQRLTKAVFIQSISQVLLLAIIVMLGVAVFNKNYVYFGITPDGKLLNLVGMHNPVIVDDTVKSKSKETLLKALNLNFDTYRTDIEAARAGFSDQGLSNFIRSLKDAGIIDLMIKNRVNARTDFGLPIISAKGIDKADKASYWKVEYPIKIRFVGQNNTTRPMYLVLVATVKKVDATVNPQGFAITQTITRPLKDAEAAGF